MREFLRTLFEFNEDNYILIWLYDRQRRKESYWFKDYHAAAGAIEEIKDAGVDIYAGVGLSPKDYGQTRRCLQKDIAGIPAFWIDIDIADGVHKKQNLPRNTQEAMKLFEWLEQKPTMVVHSGHGLQAWWVFKEPWLFDSDAERRDAAKMAKRFVYGFKKHAAKYNWDVDSVHNLDRVLRVPGTTNYKSTPIPVGFLERNDNRYNPADFEDTLPDIPESRVQTLLEGELILDPNAEPPFGKFQALEAVEKKFKMSWEHNRKDLQDQSASSYDLALANYAAMAAWSEQEICNLLIAHRRFHKADLKLRQDYYKRTISIALKSAEKYRAEEEILTYSAMETEEKTEISPEQREALLQHLSTVFNVRILQIIKYITDPPAYRLITASGSIALGDVDNLICQGKLRNKLAAATGKYLPRFKTEKWDNIAQQLLNVCVEQSIGEEATEAGHADSLLQQYLFEKTVQDSPNDAVTSGEPFKDGEHTYIFGPDFRKWIRIVMMEKVTPKQLGIMLRSIGAEPERRHFVVGENGDARRTTRSVWKLRRTRGEENNAHSSND